MKNLSVFLFICISSCFLFSQNTKTDSNKVKQFFYRNGKTSMITWYGNDKKRDSVKTYHKTGKLDELFYYLNGRLQGNSYKYNRRTKSYHINFSNDKLVERTDRIMQFNKKIKRKLKIFILN